MQTNGIAGRLRRKSGCGLALDDRFDAFRTAQEVALAQRYTESAERGQLGFGLDALGKKDTASIPGE